MEAVVKVIAQVVNPETGEVLKQEAVFEKAALLPKKITELGFNHKEQINILQGSQDVILGFQADLMNNERSDCPLCQRKTTKNGKFSSDFHSVFTDHKMILQRRTCTCGWTSKISIDGTYGSALHPDLVELQSLLGSQSSFQKAELYFEKQCCSKRSINNHSRIQKTVNQTGHLLSEIKQARSWVEDNEDSPGVSDELILAIDGAHLYSNDKNKRSFEAITATVYNPNHVVKQDNHHNKILSKTVVASAKNDRQQSIKQLTKHACLKQGLTKATKLTVLTDGAKNCWSVISNLSDECDTLVTILDWFHVGKKFKNTEHLIPDELKEDYIRAKWCLWHGNPKKALNKLKVIRGKLKEKSKGLSTLIEYIKNNESHLVDYQDYEKSGKVFTSQLAESMVNNLVNERQKHDKRMQWSRDGADAILQIRASKQSGDWKKDWQSVRHMIYKEAA